MYAESIKARAIRCWFFLGLLLVFILILKDVVRKVNIHTSNHTVEVGYYISEKSPYHIFINLDEQKMYVYKDNILHKIYPVSGGKKKSPSPVGEWVIIEKQRWGGSFGGAWMGLNVPWGRYGIHGTKQPWAVGQQNISGGCIRMKNEDARDLYEYIPHGTKVIIAFESQPFRNLKDGDIGSDVYKVQTALKQLGYYNNWCDGKFGEATKRAVLKFQDDFDLAETGIVNISTWEKLMKQYEESLLE
ncbi:MAG: L,D-transpeptidase family protein [Clostridiaceae bacterium]|nr:L,D-transpeptidase family protein [Clostridiaceae bacterium]